MNFSLSLEFLTIIFGLQIIGGIIAVTWVILRRKPKINIRVIEDKLEGLKAKESAYRALIYSGREYPTVIFDDYVQVIEEIAVLKNQLTRDYLIDHTKRLQQDGSDLTGQWKTNLEFPKSTLHLESESPRRRE